MWAALLGLMLVCSTMTCPGRRGGGAAQPLVAGSRTNGAAVQEHVHVTAARDLGLADARRPVKVGGQLLGHLARLAAQRLGEVEGRGEGEVAELGAGRILEGDGAAARRRRRREPPHGLLAELGLDVEDHGRQAADAAMPS